MIKLQNTYLGYTSNLKPMQKAKIEKTLNGLIRSEGNIYTQKEFILNRVKEGYKPFVVEDYCYYKKDGKLTKPKTDYRLKNDEGVYFTINKTLYDFAIYIIDNNFIDNTVRENHIIAEQQEFIRQGQIEKEKELHDQQEKELNQKQEQEFKNWLESETKIYNNNDKLNLAKEIFLYEQGGCSDQQLKKLLILIDNIDNSLCRENLISWLHCGNKTSKKVFYHVTGIKLPSTDKDTKRILETLTLNDYIGIIDYKPRKKAEEKELKTFYKMMKVPEVHFEKSLGEEVLKYGLTLYLIKTGNCYSLTEAKSGCSLVTGMTKEELFRELKSCIDRNGIDKINGLIEYQIEMTGLSPLYKNYDITTVI